MATTTDQVRFVKTAAVIWQGNGFGDSRADWVALIGDVLVGVFANDGRISQAFGSATLTRSTTTWKRAVRQIADRGDWI
jgi:hypothetical protein